MTTRLGKTRRRIQIPQAMRRHNYGENGLIKIGGHFRKVDLKYNNRKTTLTKKMTNKKFDFYDIARDICVHIKNCGADLDSVEATSIVKSYLDDRLGFLIGPNFAQEMVRQQSISEKNKDPSEKELSEEDYLAFLARANEKPWKARTGMSPSEFIQATFGEWIGKGLARSHIAKLPGSLGAAYATEVSRNPKRRVFGLIEKAHKLPLGAPRPVSALRIAERTAEQKEARRRQNRESWARHQARRRSTGPSPAA